MSELVSVVGRTISLSNKTPPDLTFTITEQDTEASKCTGKGSNVLIQQITLNCNCSGKFGEGLTFVGTGMAAIVANTNRVKCEGQSVHLKGDNVVISCSGTVTETSSGTTSPGSASVKATITNTNQDDIFASKT